MLARQFGGTVLLWASGRCCSGRGLVRVVAGCRVQVVFYCKTEAVYVRARAMSSSSSLSLASRTLQGLPETHLEHTVVKYPSPNVQYFAHTTFFFAGSVQACLVSECL